MQVLSDFHSMYVQCFLFDLTKKSLPLPIMILKLLCLLYLHVDNVQVNSLAQARDVVQRLNLPCEEEKKN